MKTSEFEEQFTAWLDGQMGDEAAAAFELELRARGFDPEAERSASARTTAVFRRHSQAPKLGHASFFNHQIQRSIRSELEHRPSGENKPISWWRAPRLVWAAAACLLMALVLFKSFIPVGGGSMAERSTYFATVVDARTFENSVSASTVYNPTDNVTVLWLDGLDYLPADFVLQ